jgi:hypothetical protein
MYPKFVQGQQTGVQFPTTIESFREQGADFLTRAFRAVGSMPADDSVTAIAATEFVGGGMGRKLHLDIEYERGEGLHKKLFVKFPHDFGHPQREAFTPTLELEARFYLMSIRKRLPINIPAAYFADFDSISQSGIIITERVAFGENGVEPFLDKCQEFTLSDPLEYYRAIVRSIATLAGADKSGKLGVEIAEKFPTYASRLGGEERFPLPRPFMLEKVAKIREYAAKAPQLLPKNFASEAFLDQFAASVQLVLDHDKPIYDYLNSAEDFIALCHWNCNPDNAWFWRDASGVLQVGLLDWGNVSQLNIARAFWGMACTAELEFLDRHRHELMQDFVRYYREAGGPRITVEEFEFQYRLSCAADALLWMCDAPAIIETHLPNFAEMSGRHDQRLQDVFLARAQQHILTVMLNEFTYADMPSLIPALLSRR